MLPAHQVEIMHAVEDLVKIIKAYPLDEHLDRVQNEVGATGQLCHVYCRCMQQCVTFVQCL